MAWVGGTLVSQLYFESRDADLNLARFESLHDRKGPFEETLGERATWDGMPGRKAARIVVESTFTSIEDRDAWPSMAEWLIATQVQFRAAISAAGGIYVPQEGKIRPAVTPSA